MFTEGLYILAVLCLLVALSEWLVQRTVLKHFGTALLVILMTAIVANIGLLPAGSSAANPVPVYDGIFGYVAPLAIFFLLLQVNLRDILKAGKSLIGLFLLGAAGTAIGVIAGMWVINGREILGENFVGMGGMFVGTYTGGGINFNALAIHYGIVREGLLYGGAIAIDNIMTAIWMMATIAIPKLVAPFWKAKNSKPLQHGSAANVELDREETTPMELGILLCIGFASLWISELMATQFSAAGLKIPSIVLISIIALIIAQIPAVQRIHGAQVIGSFAVTLFLAVIGAFCDLAALSSIGPLGMSLLLLVTIVVLIHGIFVFAGAWLFRLDPALAAVASQANIGGAPSALALARSIGRNDLVLPAVLIGSLGYAIGTFLGLGIAEFVLVPLF
ncbi:MAG: DUF819 family protein [Bacteroidota bacterium]